MNPRFCLLLLGVLHLKQETGLEKHWWNISFLIIFSALFSESPATSSSLAGKAWDFLDWITSVFSLSPSVFGYRKLLLLARKHFLSDFPSFIKDFQQRKRKSERMALFIIILSLLDTQLPRVTCPLRVLYETVLIKNRLELIRKQMIAFNCLLKS